MNGSFPRLHTTYLCILSNHGEEITMSLIGAVMWICKPSFTILSIAWIISICYTCNAPILHLGSWKPAIPGSFWPEEQSVVWVGDISRNAMEMNTISQAFRWQKEFIFPTLGNSQHATIHPLTLFLAIRQKLSTHEYHLELLRYNNPFTLSRNPILASFLSRL